MKPMFLSLVCLCIATCLSAQSVSDSLRLEIVSIVPAENTNYNVNIAIENHTKKFCYVLYYKPLELCDDNNPCWRVRFEVEYKDGERSTFSAVGAFFMEDLKAAIRLMPGERRTDTMPLFFDATRHGNLEAIAADGKHGTADIKRIRFLNGTGIMRELNTEDRELKIKSMNGYRECTIASDWYYPDFK